MSSPKGKGSFYPRDRDNYPGDHSSYRGRDNDPTRPRNFPVPEQPMTTNVVPYTAGYQGYVPSEPQDSPARKTIPARLAFILISFNDFEKCARLVKQHPTVLREDVGELQRSAITYYQTGDADSAQRCLQRAVLINYCNMVPQEQVLQYILSLRQRNSNRTAFDETYNRVKEDVMQKAGVREVPSSLARRPSAAASPNQPDLTQHMQILTLRPQQSRRSSSYVNQDSSNIASITRYPSGGEASRGPRSTRPYIEERAPETEPEAGYQIIRDRHGAPTAAGPAKIQVRGAQTSSLDASYKVQERPGDFFVTGKIFKVLWHQPAGANLNGQVNHAKVTNGAFGEPIYSALKWMMVVVPKHGYCICCPISTYSKGGLGFKLFNEADIRAHAILYSVGTDPQYAPGEQEGLMTKDPIAVSLAPGVRSIDPASRVHFGKYHTVEYNVKVMDIGQVISADRRRAMSYFTHELGRS